MRTLYTSAHRCPAAQSLSTLQQTAPLIIPATRPPKLTMPISKQLDSTLEPEENSTCGRFIDLDYGVLEYD